MNSDLSSKIRPHNFADASTLARALARSVADDLRAAVTERGFASLALSGGNTPKAFLQSLAAQDLQWSSVAVTLVDERWVPESHERSNAALVRNNLLHGPAAQARFVPLYRGGPEPDLALADIEQDLAAMPSPFDVVVLGMGGDGHTASFFPGGDHLEAALDPTGTALVVPMRAPGAGEPRITLTLPPIIAARHLYLHIEGGEKQRVLQAAVEGSEEGAVYPIRSVLQHACEPVLIYWTA